MPEPTELRVVADARRGDPVAVTALYEHFKEDVFRFIYYRTRDVEVAADLTADVFERMIAALPAYRPERPFAAWLFRIARHRVIDYWRRQEMRQEIPLQETVQDHTAAPEQAVGRQLTAERLVQVLHHLTPEQQEVLLLRFVVGMKFAEVAVTMDKSEGAAQMLQHRALEALRRRLGPGEE